MHVDRSDSSRDSQGFSRGSAIARYEAAAKRTRPSTKQPASEADALLAQFIAVEDNASPAQRVREVVASSRRKAVKPRKAAA